MPFEVPEVKRCCCCLPLRRGLLLWMYLKPIISLLTLGILAQLLLVYDNFFYMSVLIFYADVAFTILFLISAHKKSHKCMRIYYYYAGCMFHIGVFGLLVLLGLQLFVDLLWAPGYYTFQVLWFLYAVIFIHLVLQAYLVILVRSELLKLERQSEMELTNITPEGDSTAGAII